MQALRYFLLSSNLFMKLESKAPVDSLQTFSHKLRCPKLHPLDIHCPHYHRHLILLCFHPPALFWWHLSPAVTRRKHCGSFISLAIRVCKLVFLLNTILEKVWRIFPLASGFALSWYIYCLTKFYQQKHSFLAWHLYCEPTFEVFGCGEDSCAKQLSVFSVLLIAYLLSQIGSGDQYYLCTTSEGVSRSSTQTGCSKCLYFWHYYKQTHPSIGVMPSHFIWIWQRFKGMLPSCCSAAPFGPQFEDQKQGKSDFWLQVNNKAMTRPWRWIANLYRLQLNWAGHGA